MRAEIPPLFGLEFNPATWNRGVVRIPHHDTPTFVLLSTLDLAHGDHFASRCQFVWNSQSGTKRDGQLARNLREGFVHLFVRPTKRVKGGGACPFVNLGVVEFQAWQGDAPITFTWAVPRPTGAQWSFLQGGE